MTPTTETKAAFEARLASDLSDQLAALATLEAFKTENQVDVSVVWRDGDVSNHASCSRAMQVAVNAIVADNLNDLFATAVARQREKVKAARSALLDLLFAKPDVKLDEALLANGEAHAPVADLEGQSLDPFALAAASADGDDGSANSDDDISF